MSLHIEERAHTMHAHPHTFPCILTKGGVHILHTHTLACTRAHIHPPASMRNSCFCRPLQMFEFLSRVLGILQGCRFLSFLIWMLPVRLLNLMPMVGKELRMEFVFVFAFAASLAPAWAVVEACPHFRNGLAISAHCWLHLHRF